MTVRERIGDGARVAGQRGREARKRVAESDLRESVTTLWETTAKIAQRQAELARQVAGLDPYSPRHRVPADGSVKDRVRRRGEKASGAARVKRAVRRADRFDKTMRQGGAARGLLRRKASKAMPPQVQAAQLAWRHRGGVLRSLAFLLLLMFVCCYLFWTYAVPAPVKWAAGLVIPGTCEQTRSAPDVDPGFVGKGVEGMAHAAGSAVRGVAENPPSGESMREFMLGTARLAGKVVGGLQSGLRGQPEPLPKTQLPGYEDRLAAQAPPAIPGPPGGAQLLPGAAPQAGIAPIDELARGIATLGVQDDDAVAMLAIAGAESNYDRKADNPRSSAHGWYQILTGTHDFADAQAEDPREASKFALRLKRESPDGWAGPWAETYGKDKHLPYIERSRAAWERATGRATVGTEVGCGLPEGTVMPASAGVSGPNGRLDERSLTPLSWVGGQRLRSDAAAQLEQLNVAYQGTFGVPLIVTDSYRDYAGQVAVRRAKPGLAAVPGTSNHGWAVAVDLGGGIQRFQTPEHEWMRANAGRFGWVHPPWARQGGRKPEAWHWEFGDLSKKPRSAPPAAGTKAA